MYLYSSGFHRCFSGTVALNLVIESKGNGSESIIGPRSGQTNRSKTVGQGQSALVPTDNRRQNMTLTWRNWESHRIPTGPTFQSRSYDQPTFRFTLPTKNLEILLSIHQQLHTKFGTLVQWLPGSFGMSCIRLPWYPSLITSNPRIKGNVIQTPAESP